MTKIFHFGEFLKICSLWSNSVTRQVSLIGQKLVENAKIQNSNTTLWVILKHCEWVKNLALKWKLLHHIWNVHDMGLTVFEKNYSSPKCTCFADYFFFKKRFNSLFDFLFLWHLSLAHLIVQFEHPTTRRIFLIFCIFFMRYSLACSLRCRGRSSPFFTKKTLVEIIKTFFLVSFCCKQENKHLKTLEKNSLYFNFFAFALVPTKCLKMTQNVAFDFLTLAFSTNFVLL